MSRYARLRLAEDFDEVRNRQLRFTEQRQKTQTRVFRRGFETPEQRFKSEPIVFRRHPRLPNKIHAYLAADRANDHFSLFRLTPAQVYYDTFMSLNESPKDAEKPQLNDHSQAVTAPVLSLPHKLTVAVPMLPTPPAGRDLRL